MKAGNTLGACLLALLACLGSPVRAQKTMSPDAPGELIIDIEPPVYKTIKVEAVGDVWGSKNEIPPYPLTHDFDRYQEYSTNLVRDHVDNWDVNPEANGYGRYKITIVEDGKSTYFDYRDCNYTDPQYYNPTTKTFTPDPASGNVCWSGILRFKHCPDRTLSSISVMLGQLPCLGI